MENPWADPIVVRQSKLLAENYYSYTNKKLINYSGLDDMELSFMLYHATFAVVSHGTGTDPIFNYANLAAQQLWELTWNEFVTMPSRLSAEKVEQSEREKLLKEAEEKGFIKNYKGIRISQTGKRFEIQDAIVFNLYDASKTFKGQSAVFEKWKFL